ncbi:MAG TPA: hypothetical protein VGG99_05165 [Acetobacteraceae bacterium]|jgi:hypothetical protein
MRNKLHLVLAGTILAVGACTNPGPTNTSSNQARSNQSPVADMSGGGGGGGGY